MNEILLANLFFIITGSAVLVVATFVCVVCYHIIKITKKTRSLLEQMETAAGVLLEEANILRERIAHGNILGRVLTTIAGVMTGARRGRASSRKKKEEAHED